MTCAIYSGAYNGSAPPSVFTEAIVTARKDHRCYECGESIAPGNRYHLLKGLWDGHWASFSTCMICHQIKKELFCSPVFGQMWDDIVFAVETWGDDIRAIPWTAIARLEKPARDRVLDFIEDRLEILGEGR